MCHIQETKIRLELVESTVDTDYGIIRYLHLQLEELDIGDCLFKHGDQIHLYTSHLRYYVSKWLTTTRNFDPLSYQGKARKIHENY